MTMVLFSDGGARGNPGPAATGVMIYQTDKKISEIVADPHYQKYGDSLVELSTYLGETTNNVAEWSAVIEGVEWANTHYPDEEIVGFLDSELIQRQIIGRYKVKDSKMKELKKQFEQAMKGKQFNFVHILRSLNARADALVNETLDSVKEGEEE